MTKYIEAQKEYLEGKVVVDEKTSSPILRLVDGKTRRLADVAYAMWNGIPLDEVSEEPSKDREANLELMSFQMGFGDSADSQTILNAIRLDPSIPSAIKTTAEFYDHKIGKGFPFAEEFRAKQVNTACNQPGNLKASARFNDAYKAGTKLKKAFSILHCQNFRYHLFDSSYLPLKSETPSASKASVQKAVTLGTI